MFDSDSIYLYGIAVLWKAWFKSWMFKVEHIHIEDL